MQLKGKALFNLLRISWLEDRKGEVKNWQIEDLRDVSIEELFSRLKKLGLILDEESFSLYAENCNSPEELVDFVWIEEEDLEGRDQTYLLLFELWRRLLPDQFCLSVFCDELDQLIELYDSGKLEDEEPLQNALLILEDILDDTYDKASFTFPGRISAEREAPDAAIFDEGIASAISEEKSVADGCLAAGRKLTGKVNEAYDKEGDAGRVFNEVALYCAHDLERFLFDYISDQIQEKNETCASELIDAFYDYSSDHRHFDLLRARLFALFDLEGSNLIYGRILEELGEVPNLELVLLVAESLIHHGDVRLFMQAIKQALPLLKTEEEFQNLLAMIAEYYRCLDRDEEENTIKSLLGARSAHPPGAAIDPSDAALTRISHLISIHISD
jgi:hypothetical protein